MLHSWNTTFCPCGSCCGIEVKALHHSVTEVRGGGVGTWSYNMRFLVDVMEVQGQDVVLASNVHAVMVLVHT